MMGEGLQGLSVTANAFGTALSSFGSGHFVSRRFALQSLSQETAGPSAHCCSTSQARAHSELEPDDRQNQRNRNPDRQGGEGREIGGRPALLPSGLQRGERDVCCENGIDDQLTGGGGQSPAPPGDTYRGWKVYQGRWPEPAWLAYSPDYDASWEGEEDGWRDNGEKAEGRTWDEVTAAIDEWFEENGQFGVGA
jgi:hypothetical protein